MVGKNKKPATAVSNAAHQLRETILRGEDGAYLGSEEQLIEQLGVSRPTFRQAARLLDHEQLLVSRRGGHGGGFYARWPSIDTVARSAHIYLRVEGATIKDGSRAVTQMSQEATRLAAACKDETARQQLVQYLELDRGRFADKTITTRDFLKSEAEFVDILGTMCDNPFIRLFLSILQFTSPRIASQIYRLSERILASIEMRIRISEAVLAGDTELASALWRRHGEMQYGWLRAELGEEGVNCQIFGDS